MESMPSVFVGRTVCSMAAVWVSLRLSPEVQDICCILMLVMYRQVPPD